MATICGHCERDIPTGNFQLHYAHCSRNLQKCSICGEIVPIKHADEHFKESHAPIDCSLCSETIEREGWSLHQDEKCPKRIITCEFCEFPLPAADLLEHQEVCGNRTEFCHTCNKYIRLLELIRHEFYCQSHSDGLAGSSGSSSAPPVAASNNPSLPTPPPVLLRLNSHHHHPRIKPLLNESLVDREGVRRRQINNSEASQRSDGGDESSGEVGRRRWTRGSSKRRIIYTIALTGIAMLIGSFFLSRRG